MLLFFKLLLLFTKILQSWKPKGFDVRFHFQIKWDCQKYTTRGPWGLSFTKKATMFDETTIINSAKNRNEYNRADMRLFLFFMLSDTWILVSGRSALGTTKEIKEVMLHNFILWFNYKPMIFFSNLDLTFKN